MFEIIKNFEVVNTVASRARIGLIALATDHIIDYEVNSLLDHVQGVLLFSTRVPMELNVTIESLSNLEGHLTSAASNILTGVNIPVIGFGCTSASVVIGESRVGAAIHASQPTCLVTTPITAAMAAFATLGSTRIGLITPYVDEVNLRIHTHLTNHGITIVKAGTFMESDDNIVGQITPASIKRAAINLFRNSDIDAVFICCTSLRASSIIQCLELELGIPVISSNHAFAWHMLRLSGISEPVQGLGRLFLS